MKRKIGLVFLTVCLLALLLTALSACGGSECVHKYESRVTKEATCEGEGTMTFTCSLCKDSYTEAISALGHTEMVDFAVEATCTATGLTEGKHCSVCKTVLVEQDVVPLKEHDYSELFAYNSTHHYYECVCGEKKDVTAHIPSGRESIKEDEICTECGYVITPAASIAFKSLLFDGTAVYGKVSSDTVLYSFINEITEVGGAKYRVYADIGGLIEIPTKTVGLNTGDNEVYITVYAEEEPIAFYTVVIRRRLSYIVSFNTAGGSLLDSIAVEEDSVIFAPAENPTRAGYTFKGWDYDFSNPIAQNICINAIWEANDNTPYKVEYYQETLDGSYELIDTDELTGITDTMAEADIRAYAHFTYDEDVSTPSDTIDGDGMSVLQIYYSRNTYTLFNANDDFGSITNEGSYPYGVATFESVAQPNLGSEFIGWYSGDTLLSSEASYAFAADMNVEARFAPMEEMKNFVFNSTETTCTITEVIDKTVAEIIVPDYVTSIRYGAFFGCTSLQKIELPFVGESKEGTSSTHFGYIFGASDYMYNAVYVPASLKTVIITGGTAIGDFAFEDCVDIISIIIPESVIIIGSSAFYGCESLENMIVPNSVTSIGERSFYGCENLKSITLPFVGTSKEGTSNTHFGYIFGASGYSYHEEYVPASLKTVIITGGNVIGCYAFYNCKNLTNVTLPERVTSIGENAFYNCLSLTSMTIPETVTSIGDSAFYDCVGLTSITIPEDVISIGHMAFYGCTALVSVTVPESVTSIGNYAFYDCIALVSVKYCGSALQWANISKGVYWDRYYDEQNPDNSRLTINYTITYNYSGE